MAGYSLCGSALSHSRGGRGVWNSPASCSYQDAVRPPQIRGSENAAAYGQDLGQGLSALVWDRAPGGHRKNG